MKDKEKKSPKSNKKQIVFRAAKEPKVKQNALPRKQKVADRPAEHAHLESTEHLKDLIASVDSIIITMDRDGIITSFNEYARRFFGYTAGEIMGKNVRVLVPEVDSGGRSLQVFVNDLLSSPDDFPENINENVRKNGERVWILWKNKSIKDPAGKIIGNIALGNDITARLKAEEALRESEIALQVFFDSPGVMRSIVELTAEDDMRILALNPALADYMGLTKEFIKNKKGSELGLPREGLIAWVARFEESRRCGKPVSFDFRDKRSENERWLKATVTYLGNSKNGSPKFGSAVFDITENELAQKEIRSLAKFPGENPNPVMRLSGDGVLLYANEASKALLEVWQTALNDRIPDNIRALADRAFRDDSRCTAEIATGRGAFSLEFVPVAQEGYINLYGRDITERRRMEEALRQSERLYRAIGETIDYGVWVCAPDGRNIYASESFLKMVGITQQQCSDFGWGDVLHPDDSERTIAAWKECVRTEGKWDIEHRFRGVDGMWHSVLARGGPVRDEQGRITCWAGINLDISRLKETEEALTLIRKDLDRAQEVGQIGSWRMDVRRNILTWSNENHRIFGVPNDRPMTYETFLGTIHPDDRHYVDTQWNAALKGAPYDIEHRIVAGGHVKWVRERAFLEFDVDGNLMGGFGTSQDITERKQAEAMVASQNLELQLIIDSVPAAIFYKDRQNRFVHVNRSLANSMGMKKEELEGHSCFDIYPRPQAEAYWRDDQEVMASGEPRLNILETMQSTEGERWMQTDKIPCRDADGKIIGVIGFSLDITTRKKAEDELENHTQKLEKLVDERSAELNKAMTLIQNERMRFQMALDRLPAYLILLSQEYKVTFANRFFEERFGKSGGKHCYSYLFGRTAPCENCESFKVLKTKSPHHWEWSGPDGRNYDIHDFPFTDIDGSSMIMEVGLDVTEIKNAQAALKAMNETLEQKVNERTAALAESAERIRDSLAEKDVMLKEIHHRVKNNMQVISSLIALQAERSPDEAMRAVLLDVTHRVRSMALVHETLYRSADMARVDFADYSQSLLNYLWRAHAPISSGIRLVTDLHPVMLSVNVSVPLALILNELTTNSLKHAFKGRKEGEVIVSLHGDPDGQACLRVRDNGSGLPPGFDWRKTDSLGMRLVVMLAGQIQSKVEVFSEKGTEFVITIGGSA